MSKLLRNAGAIVLLAAVAGAASAGARDRAQVPDDLQPNGDAIDCVRQSAVRETRIRDDRTIDFVMPGGKTYRNTLPQACPNLATYHAFVHNVPVDQYCSGDTITVLITGATPIPGATCVLGAFQPMAKAR